MTTTEADRHIMERVSRAMPHIAGVLDQELTEVAGEQLAFSLFVWTRGRSSYISSAAERAEVITVLEAMIARWRAGMPDIPAHLARPDQ